MCYQQCYKWVVRISSGGKVIKSLLEWNADTCFFRCEQLSPCVFDICSNNLRVGDFLKSLSKIAELNLNIRASVDGPFTVARYPKKNASLSITAQIS